MSEVTFGQKHNARLNDWNTNLGISNDRSVPRSQLIDSSTEAEILFCDVPYFILAVPQNLDVVSSKSLTLEEFYEEHRLLLPLGIRSIFRARASQAITQPSPSIAALQQRTLSYRDTKNAIEILNPWFHYTELFHQCRTEYNICHRCIEMLSVQSLNLDLLRELLVLLYGQKYMFTAPDLYTEFHLFLSDFNSKFNDQPKQVWIDLQRLKETYGNRNVADNTDTNQHRPSDCSVSTIQQSNTGFKKVKVIQNILIEV